MPSFWLCYCFCHRPITFFQCIATFTPGKHNFQWESISASKCSENALLLSLSIGRWFWSRRNQSWHCSGRHFYILFSGNNRVYLFMKKKNLMASALIRFWSLLYLFCSIHYSIHYSLFFLWKKLLIRYLYVLNVCIHQTCFIISPTFIRSILKETRICVTATITSVT